MSAPRIEVPTPAAVPVKYGLLSVVQFPTVPDAHWVNGVQFQMPTCADGAVQAVACPGGPLPDVLDPVPWGASAGIMTMAGYKCAPMGEDDPEQIVRNRLDINGPAALERAVWTGRDSLGSATGAQAFLTGGELETDLLGEAASIAIGLAELEGWIVDHYGGQGIIHIPRRFAPFFHFYAKPNGNRLETPAGTLVAFGSGYTGSGPDGNARADGTTWLYATPAIAVIQGDVRVFPDPRENRFNPAENAVRVLATRAYAPYWECGQGAVNVTLGDGS